MGIRHDIPSLIHNIWGFPGVSLSLAVPHLSPKFRSAVHQFFLAASFFVHLARKLKLWFSGISFFPGKSLFLFWWDQLFSAPLWCCDKRSNGQRSKRKKWAAKRIIKDLILVLTLIALRENTNCPEYVFIVKYNCMFLGQSIDLLTSSWRPYF